MLSVSVNPLLNPPRLGIAGVESELQRLPHLNGDRRHAAKEARRYQDARQAKDAVNAIGRLPDAGEAIHLAISGKFALWDIVPAVLSLAGCSIAELRIATLGFSKRNIDTLCRLLDAGKIGRVSLLCSHYFKGTSADIYDHAATELASRGATFISLRQHAKLLLMKLADGRTVTVESSANLRSCKNIETMTLIGDPGVYRFHAGWMDELFAAAAPAKPTRSERPTPKGYSQRRAGIGVLSVRRDAESREQMIEWKSATAEDPVRTATYAGELAELIRQAIPVAPAGAVVTVPPQGASRPGRYFAESLGRAVAERLSLPFAALLRRQDDKTRHHPKAAMEQRPFLTAGTAQAAIVIDDLLTSGTTMRLSLAALRSEGIPAWGFAYAGC